MPAMAVAARLLEINRKTARNATRRTRGSIENLSAPITRELQKINNRQGVWGTWIRPRSTELESAVPPLNYSPASELAEQPGHSGGEPR